MGLLTKLITLPVSAPLLGTLWVIDRIVEEAAREADPEAAARKALAELSDLQDRGDIDEHERIAMEEALLERLRELRSTGAAGPGA